MRDNNKDPKSYGVGGQIGFAASDLRVTTSAASMFRDIVDEKQDFSPKPMEPPCLPRRSVKINAQKAAEYPPKLESLDPSSVGLDFYEAGAPPLHTGRFLSSDVEAEGLICRSKIVERAREINRQSMESIRSGVNFQVGALNRAAKAEEAHKKAATSPPKLQSLDPSSVDLVLDEAGAPPSKIQGYSLRGGLLSSDVAAEGFTGQENDAQGYGTSGGLGSFFQRLNSAQRIAKGLHNPVKDDTNLGTSDIGEVGIKVDALNRAAKAEAAHKKAETDLQKAVERARDAGNTADVALKNEREALEKLLIADKVKKELITQNAELKTKLEEAETRLAAVKAAQQEAVETSQKDAEGKVREAHDRAEDVLRQYHDLLAEDRVKNKAKAELEAQNARLKTDLEEARVQAKRDLALIRDENKGLITALQEAKLQSSAAGAVSENYMRSASVAEEARDQALADQKKVKAELEKALADKEAAKRRASLAQMEAQEISRAAKLRADEANQNMKQAVAEVKELEDTIRTLKVRNSQLSSGFGQKQVALKAERDKVEKLEAARAAAEADKAAAEAAQQKLERKMNAAQAELNEERVKARAAQKEAEEARADKEEAEAAQQKLAGEMKAAQAKAQQQVAAAEEAKAELQKARAAVADMRAELVAETDKVQAAQTDAEAAIMEENKLTYELKKQRKELQEKLANEEKSNRQLSLKNDVLVSNNNFLEESIEKQNRQIKTLEEKYNAEMNARIKLELEIDRVSQNLARFEDVIQEKEVLLQQAITENDDLVAHNNELQDQLIEEEKRFKELERNKTEVEEKARVAEKRATAADEAQEKAEEQARTQLAALEEKSAELEDARVQVERMRAELEKVREAARVAQAEAEQQAREAGVAQKQAETEKCTLQDNLAKVQKKADAEKADRDAKILSLEELNKQIQLTLNRFNVSNEELKKENDSINSDNMIIADEINRLAQQLEAADEAQAAAEAAKKKAESDKAEALAAQKQAEAKVEALEAEREAARDAAERARAAQQQELEEQKITFQQQFATAQQEVEDKKAELQKAEADKAVAEADHKAELEKARKALEQAEEAQVAAEQQAKAEVAAAQQQVAAAEGRARVAEQERDAAVARANTAEEARDAAEADQKAVVAAADEAQAAAEAAKKKAESDKAEALAAQKQAEAKVEALEAEREAAQAAALEAKKKAEQQAREAELEIAKAKEAADEVQAELEKAREAADERAEVEAMKAEVEAARAALKEAEERVIKPLLDVSEIIDSLINDSDDDLRSHDGSIDGNDKGDDIVHELRVLETKLGHFRDALVQHSVELERYRDAAVEAIQAQDPNKETSRLGRFVESIKAGVVETEQARELAEAQKEVAEAREQLETMQLELQERLAEVEQQAREVEKAQAAAVAEAKKAAEVRANTAQATAEVARKKDLVSREDQTRAAGSYVSRVDNGRNLWSNDYGRRYLSDNKPRLGVDSGLDKSSKDYWMNYVTGEIAENNAAIKDSKLIKNTVVPAAAIGSVGVFIAAAATNFLPFMLSIAAILLAIATFIFKDCKDEIANRKDNIKELSNNKNVLFTDYLAEKGASGSLRLQ